MALVGMRPISDSLRVIVEAGVMRSRGVHRGVFVLLLWLLTPLAWAEPPVLRVEILGLEDAPLKNVRALLSIEKMKGSKELTLFRLRRFHERAPQEIRDALAPFGYYQVQVDATLSEENGAWLARYQITPGPQMKFQSLELRLQGEGVDEPGLQQIIETSNALVGKPALHGDYENLKRDWLQQAFQKGYLDARYTVQRLEVDADANEAHVVLVLSTGIRYELGEVSFEGADLHESLLQAYVPFTPGVAYSDRAVLDLQRGLEDSDYFASVQVVADRNQAQGRRIPVQVVLAPRRPNKYSAGLGYGTDTGARYRLGWANRRINRAGHQLRVEYGASEIEDALTGSYRIPLARPRSDFIEFSALIGSENSDTADSEKRVLAVSHSSLQGRWRRVLSLGFQQEDFEIGATSGDTSLLIPGVSLQRIWGKERLIAPRGARLQLSLKGADETLLSDVSFLQAQVDAKLIYSFASRYRLISRGSVGATYTEDFDRLPPSIRYFTGGDQSVRGYDYNELGPRDSTGDNIGGEYLLVGSVELERHIKGNWRGALFYDVGNALSGFSEDLSHGVGFGLRWESPIGLVRVDIANAVSEDDHPWRLHLTLGPDL